MKHISRPDELREIAITCEEVFRSQIERTSDGAEHAERALEFVKTVWRKYDCEQVAGVHDKFIKMEEALFGLEREEASGKRYRDHFMPMFNCLVFGLGVISSLLDQ